MTTFDIVKKLVDERRTSIVKLEEDLGFSRNSLYAWKKSKPSVDKLQKVADYFNVSTDYLLGRTNIEQVTNENYSNHIDVEDIVNNSAILTSRDHALSDEDKSAIRALLTTYLDSSEGQRRLRKYGASEINGKDED